MKRIGVVVLLLIGLPAASQQPIDPAISPAVEAALGLRAARELAERSDLVEEVAILESVRALGRRVAAVSDRPELPYGFHVLDAGGGPQALQSGSLIGGTVVLNRALYEAFTGDDDALAFMLGHEIAHVVLRHHLSPIHRDGVDDHEALQLIQSFKSHQELEADRFGMLYAVRAGFAMAGGQRALKLIAEARAELDEADDHASWELRLEQLVAFEPILERSVSAFNAGLAAIEDRQFDEAQEVFTLFVRQFPQSIAGWVNLGTACLLALTRDGGHPAGLEEPLPVLEASGIELRGIYDGQLLDRARFSYRQALALGPMHRESRIGLALVALRDGRFDEARSLVALDDDAEALLIVGNGYFLAGEPGRAIAVYRRALELRAEWPLALKNLAMAHEAAGEPLLAGATWRQLGDDPRLGEQACWRLALLERRQRP